MARTVCSSIGAGSRQPERSSFWPRYGKVNEHNGLVPRDHWIEEWERQSVIDYFDCHPLDGYRRLTFMMLTKTWWLPLLDEAPGDVVAEPLPVFLFGVARRQPVPGLVEELAFKASGERAARPFVVRLLGLAAPACSCVWTASQSSGAMIDGCWPS